MVDHNTEPSGLTDDKPGATVRVAEDLRSAASALVQRAQFMRRAGLSFGNKRDMYAVLGYDPDLNHTKLRARYRRGGIAGRVVDAYPVATWRGGVELVEDDDPNVTTPFEKAWNEGAKRLKVWRRFQQADILSGQGRYAVLLIGAPGELETELPPGRGTMEPIRYLQAFGEGEAYIHDYELNPASERFGLPKSYTLSRVNIQSSQLVKPVHWSRILHVADGLQDDEVFGLSRLERVWNLLDDLDKVTGGGAESFWLRANQGLQLDVDKDMTLSAEEKTALKDQAEEYQHQLRRMLRTRGVTVNPLGSDVADFSRPADAILSQIGGTIGIPKRILLGSEMGQLASGQDKDNWDTQVKDRRSGYAAPDIVEAFANRLIAYKYLPEPKHYEVVWPETRDMSEKQKGEGAKLWADINRSQGETVFTTEEIRDHWYQMSPLDDDEEMDVEADDAEEEEAETLEAAIRKAAAQGKTIKIALTR